MQKKKYVSLLLATAAIASAVLVATPVFAKMGPGAAARTAMHAKMALPEPKVLIEGNGQPIVAGTVSAINGNTISITNKGNATYIIETSGAKFTERGVTAATISSVAVGDKVLVQGTVNGTSVTASSVIVQKKPSNTTGGNPKNMHGFFKNMFGF